MSKADKDAVGVQGALKSDVELAPKKYNFILSCVVPMDQETRKSKGYAFIDLSSPEAAQLVIDSWHNKAMRKYPNRLTLTSFADGHQKISKEERVRKEQGPFTNLYVEKLPVAFNKENVYDLFSKFGTVTQVKMKKPDTNV